MTLSGRSRSRTPPRLVARTMIATFATVGFVLAAVFVMLSLAVRGTVRSTVADRLDTGQRILSALEQRRSYQMQAQVATLAENPTLKAAMDTYHAEMWLDHGADSRQLLDTIERELEKLADRIQPDIVAVTDPSGSIVALAGRKQALWSEEGASRRLPAATADGFLALPGAVFRFASAPLVLQDGGNAVLGTLLLGTALDADYASELTRLSGAGTLIVSRDAIVASTLAPATTSALTSPVVASLASTDSIMLGHQQYAVKLLFRHGDAAAYALDSVDASAEPLLKAALRATLLIALGSLALAAFASLWLARTVARPIDTLSRSLTVMAQSRDFGAPIAVTGSSLEVDTLTETFNAMMASLTAAEEDTRSAYVGAIRALALALDARDPYTAGHSERVSTISVAIGHQMALPESDLDTLRLGALLHDIGKIGISDDVLRKPGPLTHAEFEVIKEHPVTGARILRTVPFLTRHLPIVELHHERPDGKGYPHGLRGDEIPMFARIVHVADAFDAITSARAYRPARGAADALQELWRHAGSQFDAEVVHALAGSIPTLRLQESQIDSTATRAAQRTPLLAISRT
jgi:putative nucleotidyltransferase with HDIG domain